MELRRNFLSQGIERQIANQEMNIRAQNGIQAAAARGQQ
jgi:hypothetical protein